MFSAEKTAQDNLKDSLVNARESGAFVHNLVTENMSEQMHRTNDPVSPEESEFNHANLTLEEAKTVDAPCVAEAKGHIEVSLYDDASLGDHVVIMGRIERICVDDDLCTDGKVDVRKINPVGRLSVDYYATIDRFTVAEGPDRD